MRLTPPRRARRRIAGLVMPWMLSLSTFLCRFAPPLPKPLPPFPLPDIFLFFYGIRYLSLTTWRKLFWLSCRFCGKCRLRWGIYIGEGGLEIGVFGCRWISYHIYGYGCGSTSFWILWLHPLIKMWSTVKTDYWLKHADCGQDISNSTIGVHYIRL